MTGSLVTVEITGADIPRTLRYVTDRGLTLLCTVPKGELTVQVTLLRKELAALLRACEKHGAQVRVTGRQGIYWYLISFLQRPVLLVCVMFLLAATLYLPSRVLFVQVEGNIHVPTGKILEMADSCGIGFGASRRAVRSERMKNALLEAVPELQWAGVNTRGCVAVITVRERTEQGTGGEHSEFGHIVAAADSLVTGCTATRGTLLCAPGQAVRAGQILISGYTDTGLLIRAEQAAGEIYGQTKRSIRAVIPANRAAASKTGGQMKKISLLIGKKRINLWKDSGISDATCDRMYEEYYITLPGGFRLPLALAVEEFSQREFIRKEIPQDEATGLLAEFGESYLRQTLIAGTILTSDLRFSAQPGIVILTGEYRCHELIGVAQRLQIGEENE